MAADSVPCGVSINSVSRSASSWSACRIREERTLDGTEWVVSYGSRDNTIRFTDPVGSCQNQHRQRDFANKANDKRFNINRCEPSGEQRTNSFTQFSGYVLLLAALFLRFVPSISSWLTKTGGSCQYYNEQWVQPWWMLKQAIENVQRCLTLFNEGRDRL